MVKRKMKKKNVKDTQCDESMVESSSALGIETWHIDSMNSGLF